MQAALQEVAQIAPIVIFIDELDRCREESPVEETPVEESPPAPEEAAEETTEPTP